MHSLCGVVVPAGTTRESAESVVAVAMEPHREEWRPGPTEDEGYFEGFWDWYSIGGRYTGRYSEYDPTKDPDNIEVCWLCHGTGSRADGKSGPGNCNGCCEGGGDLTGTGRMVRFPSEWKPCEDDVLPVRVLVNNPRLGLPLWIVLPDGTAHGEGPWSQPGTQERDAWDEKVADLLRPYADMAMVVVDVHS